MRNSIIMLSLMLVVAPVSAAIYQWVDANGVVNYSSQPRPGAKEVNLSSAPYSVVPTSAPAMTVTAGPAAAKAVPAVQSITISSPQDQETFHNPVGVTVGFTLPNNLTDLAKIQLMLDGSVASSITQGNSFVLNYPDRGTHSLQVQAYDSNGNLLAQSNAITIYVQRAAIHRLKD